MKSDSVDAGGTAVVQLNTGNIIMDYSTMINVKAKAA